MKIPCEHNTKRFVYPLRFLNENNFEIFDVISSAVDINYTIDTPHNFFYLFIISLQK